MRGTAVIGLVAVAAVLAGMVWWWKLEPEPPQIELAGMPDVLGRRIDGDLTVRATGRPGLKWIEVHLISNGQPIALHREEIAAEPPVHERRIALAADLAEHGVREGTARLEVIADTYAWSLLGGSRGARAARDVTVDVTPPRLELLTTQHNMRLGGASMAVFRVSPDATDVGVAVDGYFFPAVRGYFADDDAALALFAVPQDLTADAQPMLRATDAAGNVAESALPVRIKPRSFPDRQLTIDDAFLQRKVPEILSKVGKPVPANLVEGYLTVNRDVRRESEEKLDAVTARSAPAPLWTGPFRRQPNAAPMSAFADRRAYLYNGETIDRQTHQGYDLASLKRAPVEAAQAGVVVFAGYLGIYGDTVVIDHGLGISSLYGHLSSIAVREGQTVAAGDVVGQSGESGLAGGDHLHFSIMLHGTHIDPVEWWDPKWLREHVTDRLASLPATAPAAPGPAVASAAPAPAAAAEGQGADGQAQP